MTDVVKIAKKHINALDTQITKLEEFIRMAEALLKHNLAESNKGPVPDTDTSAEPAGPTDSDTETAASGTTGADAKRDDISVRELNAGGRMREPGTTHNDPAPQRRFPSFGRLHP